jgi:2,4-dienoyl-CoA reductase-like NADH-dependent reductase (Old Yellow Enzyme family)/nucleotide-binding universal stress UspA family protein/Tfp pilus assembly protein PilZ
MGSLIERQFPRAPYREQISGFSPFGRFFARARDISMGGICIETDYPFGLGERLRLAFQLSGAKDPLAVSGVVGWIEQDGDLNKLVGVQFDALETPAIKMLKRFVAASLPASAYPRGMTSWPLLFSHFDLGPLRLRNRVVMAPMFWGYAKLDGTVSDPMVSLYREIAQGGASMIVVANAIIDPSGSMAPRTIRIDDDRFIPGLARLAEAIREAGCVPCLQLNHGGSFAKVPMPLAPSPLPLKNIASEMTFLDSRRLETLTKVSMMGNFFRHLVKCRQGMSLEQIESIKTSFADAAHRAKTAGFEAVELHGATGYLLTQFLSPRTNKRSDDYGGPLEHRMRFPLEVVEGVKEKVGPGFPVGYRFLADEWLPSGFDVAQARVFAQRLEALEVTYLSVTGATYESMFLPHVAKRLQRSGSMVPLAQAMKETVSLPLITAGRIHSPELAEQILEAGHADLIGLARGLFADPAWPKKALAGNHKGIKHCKACNRCLMSIIKEEPAICSRWEAKKRAAAKMAVKGERRWADVLIAIDGSDASLAAVEYTRLLLTGSTGNGNGNGKRVTLFHVRPAGHRNGNAIQVDKLIDEAKAMLAVSGIEDAVRVKIVPERNGVAETIIREIQEEGYGLCMIGRRGISNSRALLFGSVSNKVLNAVSDCAVCVLG